jgi:hypothetical protein
MIKEIIRNARGIEILVQLAAWEFFFFLEAHGAWELLTGFVMRGITCVRKLSNSI